MNQVQKATVGAVQTTLGFAHIGIILSGNLVKATTDFIADKTAALEGRAVSLIDRQRDHQEVKKLREETTRNKMIAAAVFIGEKKKKMEDQVEFYKYRMKRVKEEKECPTPPGPVMG